MKKILIYTQWFDPEPTFKGLIFAKELITKGFEVEVLTGIPNYPKGVVYPGYKNKLFQTEYMDGVKIKRVYLYPNHDQSKIKRIFNYVSFAATSLFYLLFLQKKVDVIYTYHPPLTTGVVASLVRLIRRIPVVYDIQDMWPDTLSATGMVNNHRILNFIGHVAKKVYQVVDEIVVLSPGFKKLLIERGVDEHKITVIPNWCDEVALTLDSHEGIILPGVNKFKLLFAGNIGKAQNLDLILDSTKKLSKEIDFIFLGNGVEKNKLVERSNKEKLTNVFFLPAVPMTQVKHYMESASALLVFLKDNKLFEITIPSKTQAYMYFGKPIIMGVNGDAARLVLESNSGICISQNDSEKIVNKLLDFSKKSEQELRDYGSNAKSYYLENLSLEVGVMSFSKIFKNF